jgi:hypothetical protein
MTYTYLIPRGPYRVVTFTPLKGESSKTAVETEGKDSDWVRIEKVCRDRRASCDDAVVSPISARQFCFRFVLAYGGERVKVGGAS